MNGTGNRGRLGRRLALGVVCLGLVLSGWPVDPAAGVTGTLAARITRGNTLIVPPETADERALAPLVDWTALPTFGDGVYQQFDSHDRGTGAPPPIALFSNGNRDMNNFICASADALLKTALLVPYTLDEPSCPESYVRGFVLGRATGSGRLARLWLATLAMQAGIPGPKILRVYVDDGPTPVIQAPLVMAMDGSAGEIFAPPFGAGAPDLLAWYYPVVFGHKLIIAVDWLGPTDLFYYQTAMVLDPSPRARVPAPAPLPAREDARATLGARTSGPVQSQPLVAATSFTLEPGVPTTIADLVGPATIHNVRVRVSATDVPRLNDVDVSVQWDAAPPAIAQPLATLLGAALDAPTTSSLALSGTASGGEAIMQLRLPMPFADHALWSLTNRGPAPLTLEIAIDGLPTLPAAPWGRLHAQLSTTVGPTTQPVHPVASLTGRGRYVGTCLMLQGHQLPPSVFLAEGMNFLEGRLRALVDGRLAMPGTGTEAYLNSAFYFRRGPYATAFAQGWGIVKETTADLERGRVSVCRWHVQGDAIDFQQSIDVTYEIGPGNPSLLDRYRSTAFFYR